MKSHASSPVFSFWAENGTEFYSLMWFSIFLLGHMSAIKDLNFIVSNQVYPIDLIKDSLFLN